MLGPKHEGGHMGSKTCLGSTWNLAKSKPFGEHEMFELKDSLALKTIVL
jgi:hypothetical protein